MCSVKTNGCLPTVSCTVTQKIDWITNDRVYYKRRSKINIKYRKNFGKSEPSAQEQGQTASSAPVSNITLESWVLIKAERAEHDGFTL